MLKLIFFKAANITTNVKNHSSEFEGLIHKMVSKKPFRRQEIFYINSNGEGKLFTVCAYIKELLSIVKIENNNCHRCSKLKKTVELVSDELNIYLDGLHTSN